MNCQSNGTAEEAELPEQMPFLRGRGITAAAVLCIGTAAAAAAPPSLQHRKLRKKSLSPSPITESPGFRIEARALEHFNQQ